MVLQPEYKKDIHGQYLIFKRDRYEETYADKMLSHNTIEGHLGLELERINDQYLCKFDITGMESLLEKYAHGTISLDALKSIFLGIFNAINRGKDYLLQETDYILDAQYCYACPAGSEIRIGYYSGYHEDVIKQLLGLSEFFMDRVDYKDEKAVVLIYGIYQMLKGERVTLQDLITYIMGAQAEEGQSGTGIKEKNDAVKESVIENICENRNTKTTINSNTNINPNTNMNSNTNMNLNANMNSNTNMNRNPNTNINTNQPPVFSIPLMEEKIQGEEEVAVYPGMVYIMAVGSLLAFILILGTAYNLGLLMDEFKRQPDLMKVFGMVVVLGTFEAYLLYRLFDSKNKVAKMKEKITYVHPETLNNRDSVSFSPMNQQEEEGQTMLLADPDMTVCLADLSSSAFVLIARSQGEHKDMALHSFPHLIGTHESITQGRINHPAISRYHAKIEKIEEELILYDLHSTNGTYVNGDKLKANEGVRIVLGDRIRFADVDYLLEEREQELA